MGVTEVLSFFGGEEAAAGLERLTALRRLLRLLSFILVTFPHNFAAFVALVIQSFAIPAFVCA